QRCEHRAGETKPRAVFSCGTTATRGDPGRGTDSGKLPRHRRPDRLPPRWRNDPAVPRLRGAAGAGERVAVGDAGSGATGDDGRQTNGGAADANRKRTAPSFRRHEPPTAITRRV